jgi:hypothetical protein
VATTDFRNPPTIPERYSTMMEEIQALKVTLNSEDSEDSEDW